MKWSGAATLGPNSLAPRHWRGRSGGDSRGAGFWERGCAVVPGVYGGGTVQVFTHDRAVGCSYPPRCDGLPVPIGRGTQNVPATPAPVQPRHDSPTRATPRVAIRKALSILSRRRPLKGPSGRRQFVGARTTRATRLTNDRSERPSGSPTPGSVPISTLIPATPWSRRTRCRWSGPPTCWRT